MIKMKKDTYLMVNGKKIELTDEQKKQLGIEEKDSPFKAKINQRYYYIDCRGEVVSTTDRYPTDFKAYAVANYCTDKDLMHQRALHETLNRLLWRYSMTHDGDKIDWDDAQTTKHYIAFNTSSESETTYLVDYNNRWKLDGVVYFRTRGLALLAIEEIIKPFMEEHPDFVW